MRQEGRRVWGTLGATLLTVSLGLLFVSTAGAATFAVNSTADTDDTMCTTDPGGCTLREAIAAANADNVADDIPISVTGDINAASDMPFIDTPMTITGPGADQLAVRATAPGVSLFGIENSDVADTVRIEGLTIADVSAAGFTAGGLGTEGPGLTVLDGVRITNNLASGSGGINNDGRLTVLNSTIDDNEGDFGGGITSSAANASLTVVNSTIHGNRANEFGGGIYTNNTGTTLVASSTITGNEADADDTGNGVGGGVYNATASMVFSVGNTILAANTVGATLNPDLQCGGTFTSLGYNLRSNTDVGCLGFTGTGDAVNAAPGLGTFGDHGGPTPTIPPLAGSAALNSGNPAIPGSGSPACETTDQRGFSRVDVQPCDKGAVEAQRSLLTSPGDKGVHAGETLAFTLAATDPDPDPLTFFMLNEPTGATLDPSTGAFSWTPSAAQIGTHPGVELGVSDGTFANSVMITITVTEAPPAPPPGPGPSGPGPSVTGPTGQRAAALKKCKRKKGKARKKCKRKARKLPA